MADGTERTPNRRLIAARRSRSLTQEQLAEIACGEHARLFDREAAIDADYISKLERGVITWPSRRYRTALRAALDADRDVDLGLYSRRVLAPADSVAGGHGEGSDVDRQAFLRAIFGVGAGAALDGPVQEALARAAEPAHVPARVGRAEIAQVQHAISVFGDWQDRHGGGACREAVAAQVRWAVRLLDADASGPIRRELHSAVGFLADVAGWGSFDAGQHAPALAHFRIALHCAEQGQDWGLRANVLSDMARQAVYRGRIDDGLSLTELSQVRQDRLTATVRAMLSTVRARVLAAADRRSGTLNAIGQAEDHFAGSDPAGDPTFIDYFTAEHLAGDTGHALFDLAAHGHGVSAATDRLRTAVQNYPTGSVRSRALALGKLGTLELLHGDRDAGITAAHQALDLDAGLQSRRATDDLHRLHQATERHTPAAPVTELRQRLQTALSVA